MHLLAVTYVQTANPPNTLRIDIGNSIHSPPNTTNKKNLNKNKSV